MSQKQPPVLDQKRLSEYANQFKAPLQAILATLNQAGPNVVDQLIQQCVTLEMQTKALQDQNDQLIKEKTLAKTIVKEEVKPIPELKSK